MLISVWPVGRAVLVHSSGELPRPCEFVGAFDGYRFYRSVLGIFAVKE